MFFLNRIARCFQFGLKEKYVDIKEVVVTKFEEWTSPKEQETNEKNTNVNNKNEQNTNGIKNNNQNYNQGTNSNIGDIDNNNDIDNNTTVNTTGDANESAARLIAASKFRELGENNVSENSLNVMKLQRQGEEYYYVSSDNNSVEIKISSGKITRVNSIPVEE